MQGDSFGIFDTLASMNPGRAVHYARKSLERHAENAHGDADARDPDCPFCRTWEGKLDRALERAQAGEDGAD